MTTAIVNATIIDGTGRDPVPNGTVILDTDLSKVNDYMANSKHPGKDLKSGHFGFAGHNDPVQFRNVRIKKLE